MAALVDRLVALEPRLAGVMHAPSAAAVGDFFDPAMVHHGGGGSKGQGQSQNMTDDDLVPQGTLSLYKALKSDPNGVLESPPLNLSPVTVDVLCKTPAVRIPRRSPVDTTSSTKQPRGSAAA